MEGTIITSGIEQVVWNDGKMYLLGERVVLKGDTLYLDGYDIKVEYCVRNGRPQILQHGMRMPSGMMTFGENRPSLFQRFWRNLCCK